MKYVLWVIAIDHSLYLSVAPASKYLTLLTKNKLTSKIVWLKICTVHWDIILTLIEIRYKQLPAPITKWQAVQQKNKLKIITLTFEQKSF